VDKLSLFSIIFVSYPEDILILIITLAAAGYKDVINLKEGKNLIRLLLTSLAMTITTVAFRAFLPYFTYTFVVTLLLSFFIIIASYRYKPLSCFLGFLLSALILLVAEVLVYGVVLNLLGISIETVHSSDIYRLLASLGTRILQIACIFIILKIRNFKLQYVRLGKDEWIQIILFILMILSSLYTIEKGLRNVNSDYGTIINLIINICILLIFSGWMIFKIFKIRKRTIIEYKVHDFELNRIKKLLLQGKVNHAIELIDLSLDAKKEVKK